MAPLEKQALGNLIREAKPGFACGEEDPDGIFQIRMNNITKEGKLTTKKRRLVPKNNKRIPESKLQTGDVLFNATNSPEMVGKTVLIEEIHEPVVYSNHFLRLRPKEDVLTSSYLSRWLNYQFQRGTFRSMCRQWVNQATLGKKDLLNLEVPLPCVAQQKEATSILNFVDDFREKRQESIHLLDDLTQSIFLDMFGDSGSNTSPWDTKKFSDVITDLRYGTSNKSTSSGWPTLRIPNVVSGSLSLEEIKTVPASDAELERLRLEDGDLLFVRSNGNPEYVGRCALFTKESAKTTEYDPDNFIYASYLIRARPDQSQVNPVYVREFMLSHHGRTTLSKKSKTSAGQYNLNGKNLGSIPIPIPPLELQKEFEDKVSQTSLQRAKHRAHLSHLDELFDSVQQRAFDGTLWDDPVMTS